MNKSDGQIWFDKLDSRVKESFNIKPGPKLKNPPKINKPNNVESRVQKLETDLNLLKDQVSKLEKYIKFKAIKANKRYETETE